MYNRSMKAIKTVQTVVDEYVATVNAGLSRWSHRKGIQGLAYGVGGHARRIMHGAHSKAVKQMQRLGYTDQKQIAQIMKDARDLAELEWLATDE